MRLHFLPLKGTCSKELKNKKDGSLSELERRENYLFMIGLVHLNERGRRTHLKKRRRNIGLKVRGGVLLSSRVDGAANFV